MEILQRASGWMKLVAWLEIIGGVLAVIVEFPIGIITGVIGVVAGSFLLGAANALNNNKDYESGEYLRKYFVFTGVLALIGLIIVVLALLGLGIASAAR